MTTPAALRWTRAGLLAGVVLLAGSTAHVAAGGLLPDAPGLLMLLAVAVAASAALTGRELSARTVVALTVGGQTVVHVALSLLAGHASAAGHAGHAGHAMAPTGESSVVTALRTHLVDDPLAQPGMALAHLGAAVVVGLWLAGGERALWALLRLAACGVGRVLLLVARRPRPVVTAAPVRRDVHVLPPPRSRPWAPATSRRGPPLPAPAR